MPMFQQRHLHDHDAPPPPELAMGFRMHWLDIVAPVAIGGIWIAVYLWQLGRRPLVPLHDPRLAELAESSGAQSHH
jgi:hypothetical protein